MSFIQPQMLYWALLILLVFLTLVVISTYRRRRGLRVLLGDGGIELDAIKLSYPRRIVRLALLLFSMLFIVVAVARPYWNSQTLPMGQRGRDLVVVFDVSKSMLATDIAPSRLEHAKFLLRQLAESSSGNRLGLVPFAGRAFLSCPLTSDLSAFLQYVDELDTSTVPLGGTNIEEALRVADQAFKAASGNHRAVVLITDGDELTGSATSMASELAKHGVPLLVIGLGDPEVGAPIPESDGTLKRDAAGRLITTKLAESSLRKLALDTGGVYVRSTVTNTGLGVIERRIKQLDLGEWEESNHTLPVEEFPLALVVAVVGLVLYFLISERGGKGRSLPRKLTLILVLVMGSALLLGAGVPESQLSSSQATNESPEAVLANPQGELATPGEPEPALPTDPVELYNLARERQLAGDEQTASLYEQVISQAPQDPELQSRAFYNLGVGEHNQARKGIQQALEQVKAQQLDPGLQELKQAQEHLQSAEELYVRSLEIPKQLETVPESSNTLQSLADDRQLIEELQKKIEELKQLQQQARQQAQQAQQQNQQDQKSKDQSNPSPDQSNPSPPDQSGSAQKDQSKQDSPSQAQKDQQDQKSKAQDNPSSDQSNPSPPDQSGSDQKDQSKQDSSDPAQKDQPNQSGQSEPDKSSEAQSGQDQPDQPSQSGQDSPSQAQKDQPSQGQKPENQPHNQSPQDALEQARKSVDELKDKADELQQQKLSDQAQQAGQELEKASESRNRKDYDEAQKHLDEAVKALGTSSSDPNQQGQDQKDQSNQSGQEKPDKSSKAQSGSDQKAQQGEDSQKPESQDQPGQAPQAQNLPNQSENIKPEEGKIDKKTADQLLQMIADQEKDLRDKLKRQQNSREPQLEKDW